MTGHFLAMVWLLSLASGLVGAELPIRTYTTADGLPSNRVERIVKDARGFLWFSTRDGLSRFDGYQFTNFGVEQGLPIGADDLVTTESGYYWVATEEGLAKFDTTGKGPLFMVYRPADREAWRITALADDGAGGLWCGTNNGLYHFKRNVGPSQQSSWSFVFVDIGLWKRTHDDRVVTALLRERSGTIWVGSYNGLFRGSPDGVWKFFSQGLPHPHVTSLLQGRDGRLWVGTWDGLYTMSHQEHAGPAVANIYGRKSGIEVINALLESSDGSLWIASSGLNRLRWKNGAARIEKVMPASALSVNGATDLAEDSAGNIWVASSGAIEMIRGGFSKYGTTDGLNSNRILSLFSDKKGEFCATTKDADPKLGGRSYINCFDGSRFQSVRPNVPRTVTYWGWGSGQLSFQDQTGRWWIPTGQGLFRFPPVLSLSALAWARPEATYNAQNGLPETNVFRLFEDSRGDVWISSAATKNGLTLWQRAQNKLRDFSQSDGLPPTDLASAFAEDRAGNVWVGILGTSLGRVRKGHLEFVELPQGTGSIHSLFVDQGSRLWAGCGRGLLRIDSPDAQSPKGVLYGTAEGLASNDIGGITQDLWGRLYVVTGQGVDSFYPTTPLRVTHYAKTDGLAEGSIMMALRDRSGSVWFGNDQGLMRLDPLPEEKPIPPTVAISEFKIRGLRHTLSALGESGLSGLQLAASENQIEVGFVGLEFRAGKKLTYQYKLEGAEANWNPATIERTVNYASLPSGSYRFLVRAINTEGLVSAKPASLAFTIVPPIWQRAWVRFLMILAVGAAAYILYRYRLEQLLAVERIRARIATDLHDDIGSTLSQISILSEVASREARERERLESLQEIAYLSRQSMESMSDIVWAIDPEQDRVDQLAHRMRRVVSDLSGTDVVRIQFQGPTEEKDLELGTDMRRQIFLIFKESLHNALRHSGCHRVDVGLQVHEGRLRLDVQDNGCGFELEQAVAGHGLVSIEQRARMLGGKAVIVSAPGCGTSVRVDVPLSRGGWISWQRYRTKE